MTITTFAEVQRDIIRSLPHFAEYVGDPRAEYRSPERNGMQLPNGEFAVYDARDRVWQYSGGFSSGTTAATLSAAIAAELAA